MSDIALRSNGTEAPIKDEIDRTVPIPYYYQLEGFLRGQIMTGHYQAGQRVPSEKQLCEQFGVSRTTVRQAVGNLVAAGLVHRVKGKGTFVGKRPSPRSAHGSTGSS